MNKTVAILDIPFTTLNEKEILQLMQKHLQNNHSKALFIATPNPEMLLACRKDLEFKNTLQNTDLNLPDGNGIIWANRYLQKNSTRQSQVIRTFTGIFSIIAFLFHSKNDEIRFNKAIHGSDMTSKICLDPLLSKHRIFLLGNIKGLASNTSKLAKEKLQQLNPKINIVGNLDSTLDDIQIMTTINVAKPDILFIAFGAPQQEIWLARNLSNLPTVKIAMGVGGTFDFLAGILPRAPQWTRKIGLEWFYRLIRQPRKRFKRIINAFLVFPEAVIKYSPVNPDKHKTSDI